MAGSHISVIVMPIVIALALAFWISLVYYASFHPGWKHHAKPRKTDASGGVFEATHGARQLMPLLGDPGSAVPPPREAVGAESYQAAQAAEQEHAESTVGAGAAPRPGAGATAKGSRPPSESGPAGSGWPPE